MRDDSAEILFQLFQQEAFVSTSAMGRDILSFALSIQHFTGPRVWNSLPFDIRSIYSTPVFREALKTHLFKSYFVSN